MNSRTGRSSRAGAANHTGFESLLSDLTTTFVKLIPTEIDAEIERGLQRVCKFMRADRCGLAEFVEQEELFRVTYTWGTSWTVPFFGAAQFPWITGEILAGKPVRFSRPDDLPTQARTDQENLALLGVKSHVSVPLTVGGATIGVLACTATRSHQVWPDEMVQRLQVIGEVLANALARKRAQQRIDELLRFETLLSDLSAAFINLSGDKVSREIERGLQRIIQLLGLDRATLMEFSVDGSQLRVTHSYGGTGVQPLPPGLIMSDQVPWAATRYQRGDVMVFERLPDDLPAKAIAEKEFCLREGIKSLIGIPLNTRETTIGALALASMHSPRAWPPELVQRLRLVGEIFAGALTRRRTEEALVKSEQQMHLVTDALPVLIAYIDTERRYRFNNVAYEKWFGIPREQIQGRTMEEVLGAEAYEAFKGYADRALAGERVHFELETRYRGDAPRQVSGTYVPHVDEAGEVLGFYVLIQDITERKRAGAEAARLRDRLAYMARVTSMGEFAASLAHELNQPLAAILSNAQAALRFLEQVPPDLPEVREALDDVVADDKRAGEVIRRLRSLFKGGRAQHTPLDINEVIEQVAQLIRSDAAARKIDLLLDLEPGLPNVLGDRVQLQQVIFNLVLNGFDALNGTEAPYRKLAIHTFREDSDTVAVSVRDWGSGLDEETLNHMFDPFFTTKSHGIGMGLAISRSIVGAHGGQIRAGANSDRGVTVRFTLPVYRQASE